MSRWTSFIWRALAAIEAADPTFPYAYPDTVEAAARTGRLPVDLSDDASVRAAFRSIVEWEWGASAFKDNTRE
ncbi:hypothetical protein [Micromonospora zamorensis]|uniref:hypothetical protein n=1 Tax=Micromonospora zamorensis TaxID=709883 RepID=UPI003CF3E216